MRKLSTEYSVNCDFTTSYVYEILENKCAICQSVASFVSILNPYWPVVTESWDLFTCYISGWVWNTIDTSICTFPPVVSWQNELFECCSEVWVTMVAVDTASLWPSVCLLQFCLCSCLWLNKRGGVLIYFIDYIACICIYIGKVGCIT